MTEDKFYSITMLVKEYERQRATMPHMRELGELSEATIRYYQQKGLLSPTGSIGKEARYSAEALWRIIFTRILQSRAYHVLKQKPTLDEIAYILQNMDIAMLEGIATGDEELSIGILKRQRGWQDYSPHPNIKLEIRGRLSKKQSKEINMLAKLLASIMQS